MSPVGGATSLDFFSNIDMKRSFRAKTQRNAKLKTQRLQRPGRRAFEEPARPHSQTMMPGRQTLCVQRKPRLPRQRTADHFSGSEHRSSLGAEADRFAKLDKMFRLKFAAL